MADLLQQDRKLFFQALQLRSEYGALSPQTRKIKFFFFLKNLYVARD